MHIYHEYCSSKADILVHSKFNLYQLSQQSQVTHPSRPTVLSIRVGLEGKFKESAFGARSAFGTWKKKKKRRGEMKPLDLL